MRRRDLARRAGPPLPSADPMSRVTTSTETPRLSSSRIAVIFRRTPASPMFSSQSRLGGNGVRPASNRRRAPRSASQPAISRPSAPRPPVMRYAASGRHRRASRTGSPVTGTNSGAWNTPSRSTRTVLLGAPSTPASAPAVSPTSCVAARSTRPPQISGCSTEITPASPHRQLCRTAAGCAASWTPVVSDPQRHRVVLIPLGEQPYQTCHLRRHPCGTVDIRLGAVRGLGIGNVEDVAGIGEFARQAPGIRRAASADRRWRGSRRR